MYRDLLLATDGSEGARQATTHAIELASQLDATLHIVSVSEDGPHSSEKQDQLRTDPEDEATQALEEAERASADAGLETTTTVRHGVAQEKIVDVSEAGGDRSDRDGNPRSYRPRSPDRRERRRGGRSKRASSSL